MYVSLVTYSREKWDGNINSKSEKNKNEIILPFNCSRHRSQSDDHKPESKRSNKTLK